MNKRAKQTEAMTTVREPGVEGAAGLPNGEYERIGAEYPGINPKHKEYIRNATGKILSSQRKSKAVEAELEVLKRYFLVALPPYKGHDACYYAQEMMRETERRVSAKKARTLLSAFDRDMTQVCEWKQEQSLLGVKGQMKEYDEERRLRLAGSRHTSPELLEVLSQDTDEDVRRGVAWNPKTGECCPDVVRALSQDKKWAVRWGVAKNPSTGECCPDVLRALSQDADESVRRVVARNPSVRKCCPDVYEKLRKEFEL